MNKLILMRDKAYLRGPEATYEEAAIQGIIDYLHDDKRNKKLGEDDEKTAIEYLKKMPSSLKTMRLQLELILAFRANKYTPEERFDYLKGLYDITIQSYPNRWELDMDLLKDNYKAAVKTRDDKNRAGFFELFKRFGTKPVKTDEF